MKKYVKIIALVLSVFTFCTILCSCDALDEMRDKQAFWQKDGSILYNGNTYVKLPVYKELNYKAYDHESYIHITEKDVPVLLSSEFGSYRNITKDGVVIDGNGELYALAGNYAQVLKEADAAARGDFNVFTYFGGKVCTAEETAAIKDITSQISYDITIAWDSVSEIPIDCSTESGYFGYYFGSIIRFNSGEYIVTKNTEYEGMSSFAVPEKHRKTIEKLYSKHIDSANRRNEGV